MKKKTKRKARRQVETVLRPASQKASLWASLNGQIVIPKSTARSVK